MPEDDDDQPVKQRLKNLTLMDCVPGYADVYEKGQKIMIVTTAHCSEIEEPWCLSLKDSWRLAHRLIAALSFHGNEKAAALLPLFSEGPYDGNDAAAQQWVLMHCEPVCERTGQTMKELVDDPRRHTRGIDPTGLKIVAKFPDSDSKPLTLHVLGGYETVGRKKDHHTMYIVRCHDFGGVHEFMCKVTGKTTIYLRGHLSIEMLPQSNWVGFSQKEPGHRFRMGNGPRYVKLAVREMRQMIGRRVFKVAAYDR